MSLRSKSASVSYARCGCPLEKQGAKLVNARDKPGVVRLELGTLAGCPGGTDVSKACGSVGRRFACALSPQVVMPGLVPGMTN